MKILRSLSATAFVSWMLTTGSYGQSMPVKTEINSVRTGSGPPLVFIPGSPGSIRDFKEGGLSERLSQHFSTIAVDPPGFGDSNTPPAKTLQDAASRIHEHVTSRYTKEPAILVGYSWGAATAVAYALSFPESVKGLVLISPVVVPDRSMVEGPESLDGLGKLVFRLLGDNLMVGLASLEIYRGKATGSQEEEDMVRVPLKVSIDTSYEGRHVQIGRIQVDMKGAYTCNVPAFRSISSKIVRSRLTKVFQPNEVPPDYLEHAVATWSSPRIVRAMAMDSLKIINGDLASQENKLDELRLPVLVVYGSKDNYVSPSKHAEVLRKRTGARVLAIDGAGHACHMFEPEKIAGEIRSFFSER